MALLKFGQADARGRGLARHCFRLDADERRNAAFWHYRDCAQCCVEHGGEISFDLSQTRPQEPWFCAIGGVREELRDCIRCFDPFAPPQQLISLCDGRRDIVR